MMYMAIINETTNMVENIVVPPKDGDVWNPPDGYFTVLTDNASVGDTYDDGEFISNRDEPTDPELPLEPKE